MLWWQIKTKISRFSSYALALFTEYTGWAAFREMSRSALKICFLFCYNRFANEVFLRIWWWQTRVHYLYPPLPLTTIYPEFRRCSSNRTPGQNSGQLPFLLAYQCIYANEVLNMHIRWSQTWWVILVPTTTHIPGFITVAHTIWILVLVQAARLGIMKYLLYSILFSFSWIAIL